MAEDATGRRIDNLEIYEKERYALVKLNPKIYALDVIYSASYSFLERAYIILDGDAEKEVVVRLRPKDPEDSVEGVARSFNNELLKYASYKAFAEANRDIRWRIVERALSTNCGCQDEEEDENLDDPLGIAKPWEEIPKGGEDDDKNKVSEEDYLDDPLGIAKPWEETPKGGADDKDKEGEEDYLDDPLGIAKPWEETPKEEKKDE